MMVTQVFLWLEILLLKHPCKSVAKTLCHILNSYSQLSLLAFKLFLGYILSLSLLKTVSYSPTKCYSVMLKIIPIIFINQMFLFRFLISSQFPFFSKISLISILVFLFCLTSNKSHYLA